VPNTAEGRESPPYLRRHHAKDRRVAKRSALLAVVTAVAQEKMKDPPKSGHEGMAKAGGAQSDAAVIAKATSAAPPDIGRNAAVMGTGADGKMKEQRSRDPHPRKRTRGGG
jgi:hypothetical protein